MAKSRVSNIIRRLRFDRDEMTQKTLAETIGVTRQTVVAIENAKYSPTLELAFQIAEVFNMPIQDIFSYEGKPK